MFHFSSVKKYMKQNWIRCIFYQNDFRSPKEGFIDTLGFLIESRRPKHAKLDNNDFNINLHENCFGS